MNKVNEQVNSDGVRQLTDKEKQQLEQVLPMWKIILTQFLEHKMAVVGCCVIMTFVLIAAFAPFIQKMAF